MERGSLSFVAGLAAAVVMAAVLPVRAQNLGGKTGLVISDQGKGADAEKNLSFGLLAAFPLGRWRFVPGVSIVPKGSKNAVTFVESTPGGYEAISVSEDPWYVSVQGDLHFTFPLGNASFYLLAAPRVDFLIAVDEASHVRWSGSGYASVDVPPYESVVLGGALGFGQDIHMSNHTLFLEVRYDRDLSPAWEIPYGNHSFEEAGTKSVFNRAIMVQIGFRFGTAKNEASPRDTHLWNPGTP